VSGGRAAEKFGDAHVRASPAEPPGTQAGAAWIYMYSGNGDATAAAHRRDTYTVPSKMQSAGNYSRGRNFYRHMKATVIGDIHRS
jgi:hypothetical protein